MRNPSARSVLAPAPFGRADSGGAPSKVAKPSHRASGLTKNKPLDARQADYLEQVKRLAPTKLKLFERCYHGTASPRMAIKAKCLDCQGFDPGSTEGIRDCTITSCPEWNYRPYQIAKGKAVSE